MKCQEHTCQEEATFRVKFITPIEGFKEVLVCPIHKQLFIEPQEDEICTIDCIMIEENVNILIEIDERENRYKTNRLSKKTSSNPQKSMKTTRTLKSSLSHPHPYSHAPSRSEHSPFSEKNASPPEIPLTIFQQIRTLDPYAMARWNAQKFVYTQNELLFFVKTKYPRTKLIIKYVSNSDSYTITLCHIDRDFNWIVLKVVEEVYWEDLIAIIDAILKEFE